MIARVVAGVKYMFGGEAPAEWFGPLRPLSPVVPESQQPSVEGRQFDYPVGYNTRTTPRQGEAVTFEQMRALSDGYDLLRLVIETRKDQMAKLRWTVKPKDEKSKPDSRCEKITAFFQSPDMTHTWDDWLRMLIEDLLVIDAPVIYPRFTKGGDLYALEPVDGATIKRVIDAGGRTPMPPDAAYQQSLHGVPTVNYTREELIYRPRNVRTNKIYGQSPVEQIIVTVNIALRRQLHQLQYYTEGSTPDLIFSVPATWNPDQIARFEKWWNSELEGNTGARRGTKFVPDGVKPFDTKDKALKDEYDEWLARIVCFAFSISPAPFIKQMNRATAGTAQEQSLAEGLAPMQQWVKTLIDSIIVKYFNATDLEFAWQDEAAVDPLEQAQINQIYVAAKVLHPDEVREDLGRDPLTPEQKDELNPPPPPMLQAPGEMAQGEKQIPPEPQKKDDASAKGALAKRGKLIDRDRPAVVQAAAKTRRIIKRFLRAQAVKIAAQISQHLKKGEDDEIQRIIDALDFGEWTVLIGEVEPILARVAKDGAAQGLLSIGFDDAGITSLANEYAIAWAKERSAEMVGMKWIEGELVENPDAAWAITDGTRSFLRGLVSDAIESGWSNNRLADQIADSYAFSDARADMIARTETARADVEGNIAGWKEAGIQEKQWLIADACCDECAEIDGEIVGINEDFSSGDSGPPLHPNCRCTVIAVVE